MTSPSQAHKKNDCKKAAQKECTSGFTLIELILVILIAGALFLLAGLQTGIFAFWREDGFLRKLTETIQFLHFQAIADQSFYRIQFDFDKGEYAVGVMRADEANNEELADLSENVGTLTLELASFLNPSVGETQTFIPPPSFPSLAQPEKFPPGLTMEDMRTMRGKVKGDHGIEYITFSPRGFSEFSVLHLKLSSGNVVTILVNPFTGLAETYREYKDFDWSYSGGDQKS